MGQRIDYLQNSTMWDPRLSDEQRLQRWWMTASFGLALGARAIGAVNESRRNIAMAEAAHEMIVGQAVYALLAEGLTVRDIAEALAMSKSAVGRIAKTLTRDGELHNIGWLSARDDEGETCRMVTSAWGVSDMSQALIDDRVQGS